VFVCVVGHEEILLEVLIWIENPVVWVKVLNFDLRYHRMGQGIIVPDDPKVGCWNVLRALIATQRERLDQAAVGHVA